MLECILFSALFRTHLVDSIIGFGTPGAPGDPWGPLGTNAVIRSKFRKIVAALLEVLFLHRFGAPLLGEFQHLGQ